MVTKCERVNRKRSQLIDQGKASEMLAYRVREHNKTRQTMKKKPKNVRSSEECDARRSKRLQEEQNTLVRA